jgi:hypothetical protein
VVTPIPTLQLQEYAQLSDPKDASLSSANPSSEEGGVTRTTLGVIIGAVAIGLLLCALCGGVLVALLHRPRGTSLWRSPSLQGSALTGGILKNSKLWTANPLAHTTDVGSVRPARNQAVYFCVVDVGVQVDTALTAFLRTQQP